ncbi:MAG: type II toxin-antitoxin system PemK/MazF family toxin [Armatimonadetes bacterium]|nr:type II toxin-antitoxin system PemK/MazF family toxin [Armatimonadota bacterium]
MTPKQRDIVLIPVPFTDLSSNKRRPILVLSTSAHNRRSPDIIVAAITSNLSQRGVGVDITTADLDEGTLAVDSHVRADKIYTLSKSIIVKRFGRLQASTFSQILAKMDGVLGR